MPPPADHRPLPYGGQRPVVMGILNATPDSFSDGGRFEDPRAAVAHGLQLVADGAQIVDVGGESTRPGASRVSEHVELCRVIPVIEGLAASGIPISIDTMRAGVAAAAVAAGASMINDVSGGLADDEMADVAKTTQVPLVVTHWRGHSDRMGQRARYGDVVTEVVAELGGRRAALLDQGVPADRIILDPGIGFSKTGEQSWALLAALSRVVELGSPVMVGASRKSLLGDLLPGEPTLPVPDRDLATAVLSALLAPCASYLRVHDVRATAVALRVGERIGSVRR